jgi:hypothetical protein
MDCFSFTAEKWIGKDLEGKGFSLIEEYPGIFLEGLRETMNTLVTIANSSLEIRSGKLPNTSLERCRCTNLLCCSLK